jgi:hypothetical protein
VAALSPHTQGTRLEKVINTERASVHAPATVGRYPSR